jgi:glycerophosphoryl diester phosphodiesterase|tara:strand:- start:37 stop:762 length:726 start_codon:yes stop_codon:yes gene_type:complete
MVEVIGHRGASKEAPENTLAATHLAFQQKADGVEVDVRLTKDNQLVCIHDKSAFRTAGKKNLIKENTLKQLQSLDVGKWRGEKWRGEAIPSLQEVLSEIPLNKKIFIEVKEGIETIDPLIEDIQKSKLDTNCISVISFHQEVVKKVKQTMESLTVNLLIAFSGPKEFPDEEVLLKLLEFNLDGVGAENHSRLSRNFADLILKKNKKVHVWTVDNIRQAKNYKEMGLSSITTNVPGLIKSAL